VPVAASVEVETGSVEITLVSVSGAVVAAPASVPCAVSVGTGDIEAGMLVSVAVTGEVVSVVCAEIAIEKQMEAHAKNN
jgi:hypothetical protein